MRIIAHRGASRECPENTLAAVERAIEIGVDAIEVDLVLSRDRRLVVRHDDLIEKDGEWYYLHELTFEQIREVDLGGGERTPDLESVLDLAHRRCPLVLDVKSFDTAPLLADLLIRRRSGPEIHVTSFLHSEVVAIGRLCPGIERSVDVAAIPIDAKKIFTDTGTRRGGFFRGYLNESTVRQLRDLGLEVFAYPVNLPREAENFAAWGVHAIYTDNPRAMQHLRSG